MKPKITFTDNILDLTCLKDIDFGQPVEIILPDSITSDLVLALNMIVSYDIDVTYVRSEEVCPCCEEKLTFKEYRSRHPNNLDNVRVKKYWCDCCGKTFYPDFSNFTIVDHQFSFNVMHWYSKLSEIMAVFFEKAFELFEALFGVYISSSTLYNHYRYNFMMNIINIKKI